MLEVCCAIIVDGKRILATQRSAQMSLPLKWEFPGGKLEPGEEEEECILREIREELQLDIEIIDRLMPRIYHYPNFSIRLIPFIASYVKGEIVLAEHVHFRWLEKSMLLELDWAAADLPIVKDLVKSKYV